MQYKPKFRKEFTEVVVGGGTKLMHETFGPCHIICADKTQVAIVWLDGDNWVPAVDVHDTRELTEVEWNAVTGDTPEQFTIIDDETFIDALVAKHT